MSPKFLEYSVILCFKWGHPKENTAASLKPKILPQSQIFWPPSNLWAGYATELWFKFVSSWLCLYTPFEIFSL